MLFLFSVPQICWQVLAFHTQFVRNLLASARVYVLEAGKASSLQALRGAVNAPLAAV